MEQRHNSTLSPEKSMLVPYAQSQLAVAPPIDTTSPFSIPPGWGIEEVPRRDGLRSDMYYYEPGTGKKFRSIREVHRHLNGEVCRRRSTRKNLSIDNHNSGYQRMFAAHEKNSKCRRMVVSCGKLLKLDDEITENHLATVTSWNAAPAAPYILPNGWIVEEVPRRYSKWSDKYYYEPGTGQKFRSLVAVEKYLSELDDDAPLSKALEEIKENKPLSKLFKLETHNKENVSRENTEASSFNSPPMKVNWVLASPQGDAWNPFIYETLVPGAVKQEWTDRFMLFMNDGTNDFQGS